MSEYRIEKIRHNLAIVMTDGSRLIGEVFLRPVSRYRLRPEEPAELLNESDPFFVLEHDGEAVLIAKSNVAYAETPVPTEEEFEIAAPGMPVEVTLTNGTVCTGSIFLETPSDRPRLLDFLNSYSLRFLPVLDPTHVLLVNTQTIAHVREVG